MVEYTQNPQAVDPLKEPLHCYGFFATSAVLPVLALRAPAMAMPGQTIARVLSEESVLGSGVLGFRVFWFRVFFPRVSGFTRVL